MSVYDSLTDYLRVPYYNSVYSSRHSKHEAVKSQLYMLGFRLGFRSVLEASVCGSVRNGRIDCIFVDRFGDVACAFEVDGSVRKKSVAKLYTLPARTEKIVVSFGTDDSWRKMVSRTKGSTTFGDIKFFRLR